KGALGGGGHAVGRALDELARGVLDGRAREARDDRVLELDVADAAVARLHAAGHAVVAGRAVAGRPADLLADARTVLTLVADGGEVARERVRGARAVRPMDDLDRCRRKVRGDVRVQGRDGGIVPGRDLAEEDSGDRGAVEVELL